jgi:hypothetical protein
MQYLINRQNNLDAFVLNTRKRLLWENARAYIPLFHPHFFIQWDLAYQNKTALKNGFDVGGLRPVIHLPKKLLEILILFILQ